VVVRLIQNAFFKAILPGLERETQRAESARGWDTAADLCCEPVQSACHSYI